ncbi:hypothetical protein LRR81_12820 [Metabacillus sp. GX 13764]|uniref:hypothetical protein n=1 Tax=Metabacillus kandeliae TaxID=2900151 RepID=UPI001E46BEB6|nr:hypothetical protein [Metabacillus kandeliae]MCD7035122.1 hypothetical protein [Metabacillus kandeliae]
MKNKIEKELNQITGLPLSEIDRSLDMAVFKFGKMTYGKDKWGNETRAGEFALHVQCSWRILYDNKILIGSSDMYLPRSSWSEEEDFDWEEKGASRFDEQIEQLPLSSFKVLKSEADQVGGLRIYLSGSARIEVFPNDSYDEEFWRFFVPGDLRSHLVVTGAGIEDGDE